MRPDNRGPKSGRLEHPEPKQPSGSVSWTRTELDDDLLSALRESRGKRMLYGEELAGLIVVPRLRMVQ